MKRVITALLVFLTLSGVSKLSIADTIVSIMGSPSCGSWIKNRPAAGWEVLTEQAWLVGFLSGVASNSRKNFLSNTDAESLYLWIDTYCLANPLDDLSDAGERLVKQLSRKSGSISPAK